MRNGVILAKTFLPKKHERARTFLLKRRRGKDIFAEKIEGAGTFLGYFLYKCPENYPKKGRGKDFSDKKEGTRTFLRA